MKKSCSLFGKTGMAACILAAALFLTQNRASAQTTIGFTYACGTVGDYYNGGGGGSLGISFTTGTASGGALSGATNPVINVPGGFTTGFAVNSTNSIGFRIRVYDGLDNTGNQIATADFNCSVCTGSVSFAGTALSVRLERFSSPGTYDDMTFGSTTIGTPVTETAPEINLQGAGMNNILDGDITPSTADGTDHGSVLVGSPSAKTFTIQNTGTGVLSISSISVTGANSSEFVISGAPSTVAAGGSADFTVTFTPTATGSRTATIHVNNDDCDEADYDFAVQGTGAVAAAALSFDGSNDYVNCGNASAFNPNNIKTMETWVKFNNLTVDQDIMTKATGCTGTEMLLYGSNLSVYFMKDCSNYSHIDYPKSNLTAGQWYHFAATWDGTKESIKLYVNGASVGTLAHVGNINTTGLGNPANGLYLGQWGLLTRPLNGSMDEARVWSRTLCQSEIAAQKDCELGGSENGLLAYYKFNQGFAGGNNSGTTTLTDATSNANNGTLTNFALNGATSNWVAPGGVTTGTSCSPYNAPEANLQGAGMNNILDGDITPSTTDGTDHGAVLVNSPSAKTFTIQNTGTGDLTVSTITKTGTNQSEFVIGGISLPATVAAGGSTTFTVTFTPTATGLRSAVVHVNNNDCDEADYDFAVQGTGFYTPATGLHFDGTNDNVSVASSANMPFGGDFTVEAWVYPQATSELFPTIFSKNGDQLVMWFHTGAGNTVAARVGGTQLDGAALSLNTWSHVALTRLGTTARLYLNGVLQDTKTTGTPSTGSSPFSIGTWTNNGRYFKGSIDEMRVWGAARTAAEILALKDAEIALMPNCLIQYYKFNQGNVGGDNSGQTTLTDIANATAENGTLNNFALTGATSNWASGASITENASTYLTNFPDINLVANGNNITDGTSTPSAANNTALGSVLNGAGKSRMFTIQNLGNENLTVSAITFSGTNAADFSTSGISLPLTIAPAGSQNFTVLCNPSTTGAKTATINIVNNDCDEGNYDFAFSATGTNTFTFSSGSDWATAANWDVEIVPVTANLTSPRAVVIAQNCTMNDVVVTFASGTSLTVNSSKTLSPSLNTYITINSGATLTVQATGSISQGRITNAGTMDIFGSYTAFYMTNNSGGAMNVKSGGSYSCPACAEAFNAGSFVTNDGTMNLGTGSTWQCTVNNNAGTITDGGNGAQITLGSSSTMNNNGTFVSRTASSAGIFNNTGTLSMPGTCNFTVKTGGTFTNTGMVVMASADNFFTIQSGATVNNNSSGTFKGIGTVTQGGTFTNGSGSFIAPGNSPGKLTVTGSMDLGSATYTAEVNGTGQGTSYDWLSVSGTATIGSGSKLALVFGYAAINGTSFDILTAAAVSGTFAGGNISFSNTGAGNVTAITVNYISGNTVRVTVSSPLAVELTGFSAKKQGENVLLNWETASETNNRGFEIQRSGDGIGWQVLGFEKGNGTTTARHEYSFLDEKPLAGLNFYRLRQMDFDGSADFSNIETVEMKGGHGFSVFPNPVSSGKLTILFDEKMEGEFSKIRLFNATGQLVKSIGLSHTMDVGGLPPGVYSLEMGGFVRKIIVQ